MPLARIFDYKGESTAGLGSPAPLEIFDAKTSHNGAMAAAAAFNEKVKLLWMSIGTTESERFQTSVKNYRAALEQAGIKVGFYESPGTAHEWQTWRRSLREFTPLLFK